MPEGVVPRGLQPAPPVRRRAHERWVSPLLRRILLVNALPLALLVVALLYLDQYQNGLLEAEVVALREQARIYAGALGQSAVQDPDSANPKLVPDEVRPLLHRLTDPTPYAQAKIYGPDGTLIADSRVREGSKGAVTTEPLPPAVDRGPFLMAMEFVYDRVLTFLPHNESPPLRVDSAPTAAGYDWQPGTKEEIRLSGSENGREMPPYIRRTADNRLLVTVAEPVERNKHTVGIILLTREAREVDRSLLAIRSSILSLFGIALVLTVLLSWYLSLTTARPILRLASAAAEMREGRGHGAVPNSLLRRRDEIGALARALSDSAAALWTRMDAIERFAADVAHELKNPLSSIRSAIETLRRVEEPVGQKRLLGIIGSDVTRLDRLINDISDASRVDTELSRAAVERVDIAPILATLAELAEATRRQGDVRVDLDAPAEGLVVLGVEGRLVQVLRNLIANAESFSPIDGRILLRARENGGMVEISVEDEGPGIPDGKLEHIFERFYSERPLGERFGQHSGLGLSISKQIVEAHHGQIAAENRRDESGRVLGARFVVRLPRAPA
ncbi:stimulus-sensing domain-containing protein [Acidisphaera rubrifaciens]|uniref:histidine kinase n=1 Tax=Acidisphaera rubrifaciens HS-AP3 TaxID=1231350 RepID=A0A0D6PAA1_9PROT|nr:stimulus-sensing domain-containing protein [Acidisphaera rubrifaciens]GAN78291.1 two component sensor histidine kinase ChvG [Acidisphaera rubrifaciens HS-AP3]